MKRWHTNKTKPVANYSDVVIIWKSGRVSIDCPNIDCFGKMYMFDRDDAYDWDKEKDNIKLWAYVDKYFEKEIHNDKDTN